MPLRKSGKLLVPALLGSSDEQYICDATPHCRLHFSIRRIDDMKVVEKDLQKKGFLPRGAYDHLCGALLMWSQRTTVGAEPELNKSSMRIRLCRRTLVRAQPAMATLRKQQFAISTT